MERNGKGMVNDNDFFSSLPEELLLYILGLTKYYKAAVKCSVLSKRWRTLYTLLPCLYLSDLMFGDPWDSDAEEEYYERMPHEVQKFNYKLLKDVSAAIFRHRVDVITFSLEVCNDFSMWHGFLHYVSNYHIENLSMRGTLVESENLPLWIFSCSHLRTLVLYDFLSLQLPDIPLAFSNLRVCDLSFRMRETPVWLNDLLPKCPVLEHLSFCGYDMDFHCIENFPFIFSSKTLLHLQLRFIYSEKDCTLNVRVETPKLLNLSLIAGYISLGSGNLAVESDTIINLKVHAPKLKELLLPEYQLVELEFDRFPPELKTGIFEAKWNKKSLLSELTFAEITVPTGIDYLSPISNFSALKTLHLLYIEAQAMEFWNMLAKLSNLESLTLTVCEINNEDKQGISMENAGDRKFELSSLKDVNIIIQDKVISDGQGWMLRFILENVPVLQKICIVLKNKMENSAEGADFIQQLCPPSYHLNTKETDKFIEFLIQK